MAQSLENQAGNIAAASAPAIPNPAPDEGAQLPDMQMSMGGSQLDGLTKSLRDSATRLVPEVLRATKDKAKSDADAANAEGDADKAYREKLAEIYKNYKPETLDFGGKPNQPEENPLKSFGSWASILGIFGSALTRQPIVSALNASAAAMNAARAGDQEAYGNAYKEWMDKNELALKQNKLDHEFLTDKLDMAKTDNAAAMAEIKAYAMANNWPALATMAQIGAIEDMGKLAKSLESAGAKTGTFNSLMLQQGVQEFIERNHRPPNFKEMADLQMQAKGQGGAGDLDPASVDLAAKTYLATGTLPALGYGKAATELRKQVLAKAAELTKDSGSSVGDILASRAGIKADSASLNQLTKMADSAISFENTALDNMKVVEGLMNKGEGTAAGPVVNRWIQAGRIATGDPDVKAFNDAIATVANEYAKVMSGSTGAAPATDSARAEANSMISGIDSPAAIREVFDKVMRPDMENRKKRLTGQLDTIKGRIKDAVGSKQDGAVENPPVNLLKSGVHTTFKNGETWTLGPDGQPVQVDK